MIFQNDSEDCVFELMMSLKIETFSPESCRAMNDGRCKSQVVRVLDVLGSMTCAKIRRCIGIGGGREGGIGGEGRKGAERERRRGGEGDHVVSFTGAIGHTHG